MNISGCCSALRFARLIALALLISGSGRVDAGVSATGAASTPFPPDPSPPSIRLRLELFYEEGCSECAELKRTVLPLIEARFQNRYHLVWLETSHIENYLRLVSYQESLGVEGNPSLYMVLEGQEAFSGLRAIERSLAERMQAWLETGHRDADPAIDADMDEQAAWDALQRRFDAFSVPGVMLAGLIDGINPCAISALVFLISLLSVSGLRGNRLLWMGGLFIASVFVTYFSLGLGAFRFLDWLTRFGAGWRSALEWTLAIVLCVFAGLSLRDAWRFHRTRNPRAITLQLSDGMKDGMRRVIRRGLGLRSLAAGAMMIGVAVTLIESVCTGQVYVPTLVWLVRADLAGPKAIGYLALYNLMHVTPLVVAFVLTWRGMETPALIRWSRRNVVPSKCLMALFFLSMAVLLFLFS